jgi:hypothetical protein
MNEDEFDTFRLICDRDKYAYVYRKEGDWRNGDEKYYVTMNEEVLYRVENAIKAYIGEFEFDYECEVREISREEWEFYDVVKELYYDLTNKEAEEEY